MDAILEFIHIVVALDAMAVAIVFVVGMVIAPIIIVARGACWWKRRVKWAAVAVLTSWFGLWLFWRSNDRASRTYPTLANVRFR